MSLRKKLTKRYLRQLLDYDPETGKLFWKERPASHFQHTFSPEGVAKMFNTKFAHKEAFTSANGEGYKHGRIDTVLYDAHRVIYAWMTGKWPEKIDHDNRKVSDNRWINLKASNSIHNGRNQKKRSTNTSGVTGVDQCKNGRWRARIRHDVLIHLGFFATKRLAAKARKEAEIKYGYHANHGK